MKSSLKPFLVLLSIFSVIWIMVHVYNSHVLSDIEENKYVTVAQVYQISYAARKISFDYRFYYNGKIYHFGEPIEERPKKDMVNKFFEVHLSTENPDRNTIYLDRPIYDSVAIKAAGFSLEKKSIKTSFKSTSHMTTCTATVLSGGNQR